MSNCEAGEAFRAPRLLLKPEKLPRFCRADRAGPLHGLPVGFRDFAFAELQLAGQFADTLPVAGLAGQHELVRPAASAWFRPSSTDFGLLIHRNIAQ